MSDHLNAYLEARERRKQAFATLKRIRDPIFKVAGALMRNPSEFSFVNCGGVELPKLLPHSGIRAAEWYPAVDIQQALVECHRTAMQVDVYGRPFPVGMG